MSRPRDVRSPLVDIDERATELSRAEFRTRLAARADIDADDATAVARAVLGAARATAAETELESARTQLPDEHDRFVDDDR